MEAKEKALDLFLTYYELLPDGVYSNEAAKQDAKRFALIAVDEIITNWNCFTGMYEQDVFDSQLKYWQQVKKEIEKL